MNIHGATWHSEILQSGSRGSADIGAAAFNVLFGASSPRIIYRRCDDCAASHQDIFYKRLTPLGTFDTHEYFSSRCHRSDINVLGTDFNLFSTLADAVAGENAWSCNGDCTTRADHGSAGVPSFGNCGPSGAPDDWPGSPEDAAAEADDGKEEEEDDDDDMFTNCDINSCNADK